jgi:hypothetical protein
VPFAEDQHPVGDLGPGREHARHDHSLGRIGPVSPAAAYEVSGMRIVQHWFDYRKPNARGRRDRPDGNDTMGTRWTLAMTEQLRDLIAVLEGWAIREKAR